MPKDLYFHTSASFCVCVQGGGISGVRARLRPAHLSNTHTYTPLPSSWIRWWGGRVRGKGKKTVLVGGRESERERETVSNRLRMKFNSFGCWHSSSFKLQAIRLFQIFYFLLDMLRCVWFYPAHTIWLSEDSFFPLISSHLSITKWALNREAGKVV